MGEIGPISKCSAIRETAFEKGVGRRLQPQLRRLAWNHPFRSPPRRSTGNPRQNRFETSIDGI